MIYIIIIYYILIATGLYHNRLYASIFTSFFYFIKRIKKLFIISIKILTIITQLWYILDRISQKRKVKMKSTRERILKTLLTRPNATISDLAIAVDINTISVRHHLTNLLAEGLIFASEVRHGVGRPRLVYSLTESGQERFPTRYLNLTNRLLEQLKKTLSQEQINEMFVNMAQSVATDQREQINKLSFEDKLNFIQKTLATEGFMIEWEKSGEDYLINEIACPFYHIGQSHPEVCVLDKTFITSILAISAEKITCILNGDHHCTYMVKKPAIMEVL
jgi:DeoR family suf operon transcriptional repressor